MMNNKLLFSVSILAMGCANESEVGIKPNIILCVADDHGMDALGCYGNPIIKTPNLDKLANDGARFTNAFCTSASSAASRSVLLTGKYGHATGAYGHVHDYHHFSTYDTIRSLPVILAENGYHTARVGKYHVAPESVYHFDEVYNADPRNTVEMAAESSKIFDSEKPFFLYFCPDDPHRGDPFKPEKWSDPNRFGNKDEGYEGVETIKYSPEEVLVPDFLPDTKQTREEIAEYYESISRIDQGFGRLMADLEASGKRDNTIVIYISDNGMAFPGAKTTLYDPGMQLPCIISDPTIKTKGTICDAMITWADMTPTLLDMAGIKVDEGMHGRSFKDVIGEQHPKGFDEILAAHNFHEITMYYPMRVLRNREFKLIWNVAWQQEYPFASDLWDSSTWQRSYRDGAKTFGKRTMEAFLQRPKFELYNIATDPDESINLVDNPQYADVLKSLQSRLLQRLRETSDPWIICWGDHDASFQGSGVDL
ncbi:MAG: sulfatase [Rikenellaceae bacterium]